MTSLAKWLSVCLQTKFLGVWITLLSLKLQIWCPSLGPVKFRILLLCFFFQLIQYIQFIFDPIFDNCILGVWIKECIILFAMSGIWHLILDRRQFALFSYSLRFFKWYLNVKCSSSVLIQDIWSQKSYLFSVYLFQSSCFWGFFVFKSK